MKPQFSIPRIGRSLISIGLGLALACGVLLLFDNVSQLARAAPTLPLSTLSIPAPQAIVPVTTTIQAAVNAALPGDTVVFTGTFTEEVVINKPLTLQGAFPTSTIVYDGTTSPISPTIQVLNDNVAITNMTLTAIGFAQHSGILVQNSSNVTITGVMIQNYPTGIRVERTAAGPTGINITNNAILHPSGNSGDPGLYLVGSGSGVGAIEATIQSNQVSGYVPLINAEGLAPSLVLSNVLTTTGTSIDGAIRLNQAGPSLIQGNNLVVTAPPLSTTLSGIYIGNTANPTVTQNSIASRFTFGVEAVESASPVIADSTLMGHSGAGARVSGSATAEVSRNLLTGNFNGISVGSASSLVTAFGNTICQNTGYGLRSSNTYPAQPAAGNWWGHNPPLDTDTTTPSDFRPNVNASPPISMALSVNPSPALLPVNGSASVTLTMRGGGQNVLDGTNISFSATAGSFIVTDTTTLAGQANTTYIGAVLGTQTISATDDCGGVVTTTVVVAEPDLTTTKIANPPSGSTVSPGNPITYTIFVTNNGAFTATGVVFSDTIPTFTQLASAVIDSGTIDLTNPISATFDPIPPNNGVMSVTLRVTVTTPLTNGTLITNTGSISYFTGATNVVTTTNSVTHVVQSSPDITLLKTAMPPSSSVVEPGDFITYTIVAANNGTANATSVVISDTLDSNVTLVTSNTISGILSGPNPVQVTNFNLNTSQHVTVTLVVTVNNSPTGTVISNQASITSIETPSPQVSGVVTHVIGSAITPLPSFTLLKSAKPPSGSPVDPGDIITYTVRVTNNGSPASGVVLTDVIPSGTTYVPGSASTNLGGANFDGTQITVNVPNFPSGVTMTATFRVTVTTNLTTTITNFGTLDSIETGPQNSNTVSHLVQGTAFPDIFLPLIFKEFSAPFATLQWVSQLEDRVSEVDGSDPSAFIPDSRNDGSFLTLVNVGSAGSKTVSNVRLTSSQGAGVEWDTIVNTRPVLGIFDGVTRLNNIDGTVNDMVINGQINVTLYASDDVSGTRFPPATHEYTVIVNFDDGSSVSARASIPAPLTPPPPPPPDCPPVLTDAITVGSTPRGIAIDPNRSRVYVANHGDSTVSVIDTINNTVTQTITGITSANGIAYDPTNNIIWVTNLSSDQVTPIQANASATSFTVLSPITVGDGPWGITYDQTRDYVYVVNNLDDSVTIIDAGAQAVVDTLSGSFSQPFHIAANPITGKIYVTNFGNHSVTVVDGTAVSSVVNLNVGDPSTQPYGVAVDETRDLVYVATVNSHRVVAIGTLADTPDQLLGWAAFHRGFGDPNRPVPMRVIAVNPDIGPSGDGGHIWTTTSTVDGSEADQVLLIPKGWDSYFNFPTARNVDLSPAEGIAIDRASDKVYVSSSNTSGTVTVLGDSANTCLVPFAKDDGIRFELFVVP